MHLTLALSSAHVKFDVRTGPKRFSLVRECVFFLHCYAGPSSLVLMFAGWVATYDSLDYLFFSICEIY